MMINIKLYYQFFIIVRFKKSIILNKLIDILNTYSIIDELPQYHTVKKKKTYFVFPIKKNK